MFRKSAMHLAALSLGALLNVARADDPIPAETRLVATSTAAAATHQLFTIAPAQDLVVTLTDLQIPSELSSANLVITQAGAIVASAQLVAPAITVTAQLTGASGDYVIYVFGVPNANTSVGTFSLCTAPTASPAACIQNTQDPTKSPSFSGNISTPGSANDPTVSTLSTTLTVPAGGGAYTFNFGDLMFPVALNPNGGAPNIALFQGSLPVIPPGQTSPSIPTGSTLTLSPGTYQLLAIAQADPTVQAGLYNINITGPVGSTPLFSATLPVGLQNSAANFNNPTTQTVTLSVIDYGFPGPLMSASALLTSGGTVIGSASAAGGAQTFAAPSGSLQLWTYGSASSTAGTFSADVAGATDLFTAAQGVAPPGGNAYAYAFVAPVVSGGAYQATAADLQFPAQLSSLGFAVAQSGVILQQSTTQATVNFNAVPGNLVLLASAQTPASTSASPTGLFDINVQSSGASAQLVFDKVQSVSGVGALLDSQPLTIGVNASFDATLTDLKFPTAFDNLALVVSRGSSVLGKIYGGGTFSFGGSPGTYQLTFLATPSADQQFGLYATSVVFSPPAVTLTSNVATAATGSTIQLNWSSTNASSCTGSGGSWTGDKSTSTSTEAVVLSATTTYTLTCTGAGGTSSQSVTVSATATAAASSSHGGGALNPAALIGLLGLAATRLRRRVTQYSS